MAKFTINLTTTNEVQTIVCAGHCPTTQECKKYYVVLEYELCGPETDDYQEWYAERRIIKSPATWQEYSNIRSAFEEGTALFGCNPEDYPNCNIFALEYTPSNRKLAEFKGRIHTYFGNDGITTMDPDFDIESEESWDQVFGPNSWEV